MVVKKRDMYDGIVDWGDVGHIGVVTALCVI